MKLEDRLADKILASRSRAPFLVAFDGVDTAGKTRLADRVAESLRARGEPVERLSIDKFHNPREVRMARGPLSPEGFFLDSFDLAKLVELALKPVKEGRGCLVKGIYDYRVEGEVAGDRVPITEGLIVLFDGIFLHRDELLPYWDLSVFLEVSFDTVRERAVQRDLALFGSVDEVLRKYEERYIPGEKLYLESCRPRDRADVLVDNNDWEHPRILRGA